VRLIIRSLIGLFFFLLFVTYLAPSAFAITSPFRSANIITTEGYPTFTAFTNLENCSATDENTCDRAYEPGIASIDFRNFGTREEYGIPPGAKVYKVHVRITGKTSFVVGMGLAHGDKYLNPCQVPPDRWRVYQLLGTTITSYTFDLDETNGLNYCYNIYKVEDDFLWRLTYNDAFRPWSANIDNFEIAYEYDPPPAPTKTPLILIPGMAGSELQTTESVYWSQPDGHGGLYEHGYEANEKVWVNTLEAANPGPDDYFDVLRLKPDGQTSEANLGLTGKLFEAYQPMIDFFVSDGYTLNKDLFVFPYDWRRDIGLTSSLLDEKIESIKQQTGSTKVDIVAHSMGGLVARNYIADASKALKINKLVTLGTPALGAVDSIKYLLYGGCFTKPGVPDKPICIGLVPSEIKDVIQNMTGFYQILPSQKYFDFYSGQTAAHPFPINDTSDIDEDGIIGPLNYSQIKTFLLNLGHNTNLFGPSEIFHNLDNNLATTNGVSVTNIVGSGLPTVGQIIEKNSIDLLGITIPHRDELTINGDNTVPLFSASLIDPDRNISLLGDAKVFYTKQEHSNLISPGPALNLAKNILSDNTELPAGIAIDAYPLNGIRISTHSPVSLHVYDSSGNHTGPISDDSFEQTIPGSIYNTLGDASFVWLPNNGQYTLKLKATGQGNFDLKIKTYENDSNTSTTLYHDIPVTTSTKAQIDLDTSSAQSPILRVDEDGDGTTDNTVGPTSTLIGGANYDETPPQTAIEFKGSSGDNSWYTNDVLVTLSAVDEASGSGVNNIEYSLDNGQTIQTYTQPFTLSQEGITNITFRSVDQAGNEEIPQKREIHIDKTPPEAKISVDPNTKNIVIIGVDANPTTVTKSKHWYDIYDSAGNRTRLFVWGWDSAWQDIVGIFAIQYNDDPPIKEPFNYFKVLYQGKKHALEVKEQNLVIFHNVRIQIHYNARTNRSTIITKKFKEIKINEVKDGLVLLQVLTNNGKLEIKY
jgi:pimeloyl-ACP methyl ester carboxylesterase